MAKMQSVNFQSIQEFMDYLPEEELILTDFLRETIKATLPKAKEKLAYNVPFYKGNRNICFLWPAAVRWGQSPNKYRGIRLGFTYGNLIRDEHNFLQKGQRKQVYCKDFISIEEIEVILLEKFLLQAWQIDQNR